MTNPIKQAAYDLSLESRFYGSLLTGVVSKETNKTPYWDFTPSGEWILNGDKSAFQKMDVLKLLLQDLIVFITQIIPTTPPSQDYPPSLIRAWRSWNTWPIAAQEVFRRKALQRISNLHPKLEATEEKDLIRKGFSPVNWRNTEKPIGLNWAAILRQFVTTSLHTEIKSTYHRPSRRYGTFPGTKIRRKPKIGLALDRSGSISTAQAAIFWGEIRRIHRQQANLIICEFDHRVQRVSTFHPSKNYQFKGGGGTDFNPPVRWANEKELQGLIIFTDGFAPPPLVKPRIPCLWVLCADVKTSFPGRQIQINQ